MKLIIIQLITTVMFFTGNTKSDPQVYICDSPNAKRYHLKENCRGLSNCTYKIIKMTTDQAKRSGKTLCRWED